MSRAYLVRIDDGERIPIESQLIIGRTKECSVILDDPAVSRKHVEINVNGTSYRWRDLGSTNGTYINGERMLSGELHPGDVIQIGKTAFRFELEKGTEHKTPVHGGSAEELMLVTRSFLDLPRDATTFTVSKEKRSALLLEALCKILSDIATNFDICELQNKILEATSKAIPIDHGAIILTNETGCILPCPQCQRVHQWEHKHLITVPASQVNVSNTVIQKVVKEKQSLLYQDIEDNEDLKRAVSIISLNVHSVMCTPLRAKEEIIGLLYLDTVSVQQRYTEEDLLLASAVGSSAGLVIENARMYKELIAKQQMEQELKTAAIIQQGFLFNRWRSIPKDCDVFAQTIPAKVVGGDFYDIILLGDNKIGFIVGDVSGKGMPSALAMVRLLTEFRIHAQQATSLVEVMENLNNDLIENAQQGMFCSACYIVLSLDTGEVVGVNAGHLPALWVQSKGSHYVFHPSGPPLGIMSGSFWKEERDILSRDEGIVLFTDGLIEARSADPEKPISERELGIDRLKRLIDAYPLVIAEEYVKTVLDEVQKYTAPDQPHDDCTLLAFRWLGYAG